MSTKIFIKCKNNETYYIFFTTKAETFPSLQAIDNPTKKDYDADD